MSLLQTGIAKSGAAAAGYTIDNSLRFNDGDSAYLSRTQTAGNRKTWTWSGWLKRAALSATLDIFGTVSSGDGLRWYGSSNTLNFLCDGSSGAWLLTNRVFRDDSAWYHIVVAFDTTETTAADRVKLYINGEQYTWDGATTFPDEDDEFKINQSGEVFSIGRGHANDYLDGYIAEVYFTDGTAYDADDFGELDSTTNQWKPLDSDDVKDAVTFGTNGFYQKYGSTEDADGFEDSSGSIFQGSDFSACTSNLTISTGTGINQIIDGTTTASSGCIPTVGQTVSTKEVTFDCGSGVTKIFTHAELKVSMTYDDGAWKWQGSNDDVSYSDIGSGTFTIQGPSAEAGPFDITAGLSSNTTAYRYYRWQGVSGTTTGSNFWTEIMNLKVAPPGTGFHTITAVGDAENVRGTPFVPGTGTTYTTVDAITSSGTWTCPTGVTSVKVLVVGGGGGGPGSTYPGGGGAGGLINHPAYTVVPGVEYDITIGNGGAGSGSYPGGTGQDSVFNVNSEGSGSPLTAKGGGGGAGHTGSSASTPVDGGSGGGGGGPSGSAGSATQSSQSGDSGTYGFGYDGGDGHGASSDWGGGGGGGAGGKGEDGNDGYTGGIGKDISADFGVDYGVAGFIAAGGASGGDSYAGVGGRGGGGNGASGTGGTGGNGTANTGSGGGGGMSGTGGSGGSGIVLVAYSITKPGSSSIYFDGNGDYLSIPDSSDWDIGTNFTLELWVYPTLLDDNKVWISQYEDTSNTWYFRSESGAKANFIMLSGGSTVVTLTTATDDLVVDTWQHVALVKDGDDWEIFVGGVSKATLTDASTDTFAGAMAIGSVRRSGGYQYFDGYMDEIRISNSARYTTTFTPSTTAFTADANTKLLIHSDWTGGLGADSSGNYNGFTPTNLDAYDQMIDTPTNNWCTYNPLAKMPATGAAAASEGNLKIISSSWGGFKSSFVVPKTGKFYCEVYVGGTTDGSNTNVSGLVPGIQDHYTDTGVYAWFSNDGTVRYSNADLTTTTGPDTGDIMSWYVNDGEVKIYLNNSLAYTYGTNLSAVDDDYFFYTQSVGASHFATVNFGQDSSFAGVLAAQNNDDDGDATADWYYAPPTGVESLCTDNLSDPEIALPGEYFNTIIWSGSGAGSGGGTAGNRALTGVGFQPDLVWGKQRTDQTNYPNILVDSVRTAPWQIYSNSTSIQYEGDAAGNLASLDSDGFSTTEGAVGNLYWNRSGSTFVAWNWKAGTTFDPTTDGSIASATGKSNATAGFSIVKYTAENAVKTIGHGLAEAPTLILQKTLVSGQWECYYLRGDGSDGVIFLDQNGAGEAAGIGYWNDTNPTPSVFTVGTGGGTGGGTDDHIAYCFHSVEGYSKVGSYTGNGNADGAFVYCGFRPAYLMIKRTDASKNWFIHDDKRSTYNVIDGETLKANTNGAEVSDTGAAMDFVSNGFKQRTSDDGYNDGTYLYLAFAESPFKYSNAR